MKRCLYFFLIVLICLKSTAGFAQNASAIDILGWKTDDTPNDLCEGYYLETPIDYPYSSTKPSNKSPLDIQANSTHYAQKGQSLLQGNVTVTQPGKQLLSDKAYLIRDPKTGKINVIHAVGDVRLREPGRLLQGSEATVTLDSKTWIIQNPTYRLVMDQNYNPHIVSSDETYPVYALSGWGQASDAEKKPDGNIVIHNGSFSTCSPENAFWKFHASTITLNRESGQGKSYNNVLYMKDIPVFYTPYASFPIDKQRKTGFLFPTLSTSSTDGLDVAVPLYLNLAPNYDATITTHANQKRGARFDGLFRYLLGTPDSTGNISGIWLPHDKKFSQFQESAPTEFDTSVPANRDNLDSLEDSSDSRRFVHVDNKTQWSPHWKTSVEFNHASDDYFSEDFSSSAADITDQQLLQQINTTYANDHWEFLANVQGYQTLHPIDQSAVSNSYTRLPQLSVKADYPESFSRLNLGFNSDLTNFTIKTNPGETTSPVNGLRYNFNPSATELFKFGEAGFIKPNAQLYMTTYQLQDEGSLQQNPTVAVPIFDVDTGLFFDRETHLPFTADNYTQTLEPRLFYLYVPYRDQSNIPIFDTSVRTFDASQLFATNRFTGLDRIGDANQVSLSLTSRYLEAQTGKEKLSATLGEIFYFEDRRVQLCNNEGTCDTLQTDTPLTDGTSSTKFFSPVIAEVDYHLTDAFSTVASAAADPSDGQFISSTLDLQYKPEKKRLINLGYSFLREGDIYPVPTGDEPLDSDDPRNNLSQIDVSFTWPVWGEWSALGRYNYNISHEYAQDYFYGLQYDSSCWAIRMIGSHYFNNFDEEANPEFKQEYYLQFLFKGLGTVGSANPSGLLNSGIHGYTDPFGKSII